MTAPFVPTKFSGDNQSVEKKRNHETIRNIELHHIGKIKSNKNNCLFLIWVLNDKK